MTAAVVIPPPAGEPNQLPEERRNARVVLQVPQVLQCGHDLDSALVARGVRQQARSHLDIRRAAPQGTLLGQVGLVSHRHL